jgi:DNA polymerase-4
MDAFYASVEQLDDPSLRGKPVLVGYDGPRGVVAAASYEARAFGCHSAQPISVARRQCPDAIVVPGRGRRYHDLSKHVFAIFDDITPLVQPLSIDEAFLDVTGSTRLLGPPHAIATLIKRRIQEETVLTASVGLAPNKFLAKLVSDWDKPDGLTVITADELPDRLAPLPIRDMWGVGPASEQRLRRQGIRTFGDLQQLTPEDVRHRLGEHGEHLRLLSLGIDERVVTSDRGAKSIGHEQTFEVDLEPARHVRRILLEQCEQVARRVRKHDLRGRTITVKIRFGDFKTISRSATVREPTDRTDVVWGEAARLFDRWCREGFHPVRLIGVTVSNLEDAAAGQLGLFADPEADRRRDLDRATDAIRERFGARSIGRGVREAD